MILNSLKIGLVFIAVTLSQGAQAQNCLDSFCVGKKVLDANSRVGLVVSVTKDWINYTVFGKAYRAAPQALSPEVDELKGLKAGVMAVGAGDIVGSVRTVFQNGLVEAQLKNKFVILRSPVPEVPSLGNLKKNGKGLDSKNIGKVLHVFSDKRVQFEANKLIYVSSRIVPEVDEFKGLKAGLGVIDSADKEAKIISVFEDGRVETVLGLASIVYPEVAEVAGVKKGTKVLNSAGEYGEIQSVYQNQKCAYLAKGTRKIALKNQLSIEIAASKTGEFTKNTIVMDQKGHVGPVVAVFDQDKIAYSKNGYVRVALADVLSSEVSDHPKYKKNVYYSDENFIVGKVVYFFKDGRSLLTTDDGYTTAAKDLFGSVLNWREYVLGFSVYSPDDMKGVVTEVFENGALQWEYMFKTPAGKLMTKTDTARTYGSDKAELDQRLWLQSVTFHVQKMGSNVPSDNEPNKFRLVIDLAKVSELNKSLVELLTAEPQLIPDVRLRTAVLVYLKARL